MTRVITESSNKKEKRQVNKSNLVREYRDCIKSRWGILNEEGDMHIVLGASDMSCDPNFVSSAFYAIPIFPL